MKKITQNQRVHYVSESRLFLNRERTKLVKESSQEAHELYATPGTLIPEDAAEKFGLLRKPRKRKAKSEKPAEDKQLDPAEDKQLKGLKINKLK